MSKTRIKEWYSRFKGGRTSVDSDSRSGRPSTTKTLDNIERVRLAIEGDRRLTIRELENDLGHGVFKRPKSLPDLTLKSTYVVSFLESQITQNRQPQNRSCSFFQDILTESSFF